MSFERIFTRPGVARPAELTFNRRELSLILNVYGRMVAAGEWRDYAIDHRRDRAVFSIFRGSAEQPLYRVEKARGDGKQPGCPQEKSTGSCIKTNIDRKMAMR